jgi:hypothetical protein
MDLTPDGVRYITSVTERVARPFHYRWLIPKLCRDRALWWHRCTYWSLWACLPALWWYIGGWHGVAAAAAFTGLAGLWQFNRAHPVLVDAPAMLLAVLAADACRHGLWPLGLALAVVAGCIRETSPAFAAIFAWSPIPLVGLIAPAIRHLQKPGADPCHLEWTLDHPFAASRKFHAGMPFAAWVLPWGAALLGLAHPSWQLAAVLALAYGQCAVATDTVRLYQWAAPVLLAAAVTGLPLQVLPLFVVAHLANPFRSEGG